MKNAVIVPVGAKGGFVVQAATDPVPDRGRGLLPDVHLGPAGRHRQPGRRGDRCRHRTWCATTATTPTWSSPRTRAPPGSPTWPTTWPPGTASGWATRSPPAGRSGYDHKAMGITARGAWESVRRHFRELGVDTQTEEFTVVGIGDMSGDVFGNGMLLSPHIRLVAAFDHRHVFVDPDPDPAVGYAERRRLFALPRSSWDDYDRAAISPGGGVWLRTAKSVPIGPEIRAALGLPDGVSSLTPAGADPGRPARAGRPAVERRYRHLRQGRRRDARRGRGQGQRRDPGRRRASCGSGSSARAATWARPSSAGSSSPGTAAGSTPTRSTTPPAWTAPTTRSTSRSCWTGWSRRASWTGPAGTRCWSR